jgi:hypothetical protein
MKRHGVNLGTTSRALADHEDGFSANGESMYSRQAAHSTLNLPSHVAKTKGKHSLPQLIAENQSQLATLRGNLLIESCPVKRAKIENSIGIKSRFLARIINEQRTPLED